MLFEYLEDRCLLAATLSNGTLTVVGGSINDNIALTMPNASTVRVQINKTTTNFQLSAVTKIVIQGLAGNDTINMSAINKPSTIEGGDGNDKMTGGPGRDSFLGGAGRDTMIGGANRDTFAGGADADTVDYSASTANLTVSIDGVDNDGATNERDNVRTDVENVIDGTGNAALTGSASANALRGRAGNDAPTAGAGHDDLYGESGDDLLRGNAGADWIVGGSGTDTADYSDKTAPLTITLNDALFNDGEVSEGDNV